MTKEVKVITVSDLHQSRTLFQQLRTAVNLHKPDLLALVGDFLDLSPPTDQKLSIQELAVTLTELPVADTVFVPGNHETSVTELDILYSQAKKFNWIEGNCYTVGPLTLIGFPCEINSYRDVLAPDISGKWLPKIMRTLGPAGRTLWLMHEPPIATALARKWDTNSSNHELQEAIERFSPRLVIFGHDHETPILTNRWIEELQTGTLCVNVGQQANQLHYTVISLVYSKELRSLPMKMTVTAYPKGESIILPSPGTQ